MYYKKKKKPPYQKDEPIPEVKSPYKVYKGGISWKGVVQFIDPSKKANGISK